MVVTRSTQKRGAENTERQVPPLPQGQRKADVVAALVVPASAGSALAAATRPGLTCLPLARARALPWGFVMRSIPVSCVTLSYCSQGRRKPLPPPLSQASRVLLPFCAHSVLRTCCSDRLGVCRMFCGTERAGSGVTASVLF